MEKSECKCFSEARRKQSKERHKQDAISHLEQKNG